MAPVEQLRLARFRKTLVRVLPDCLEHPEAVLAKLSDPTTEKALVEQ